MKTMVLVAVVLMAAMAGAQTFNAGVDMAGFGGSHAGTGDHTAVFVYAENIFMGGLESPPVTVTLPDGFVTEGIRVIRGSVNYYGDYAVWNPGFIGDGVEMMVVLGWFEEAGTYTFVASVPTTVYLNGQPATDLNTSNNERSLTIGVEEAPRSCFTSFLPMVRSR